MAPLESYDFPSKFIKSNRDAALLKAPRNHQKERKMLNLSINTRQLKCISAELLPPHIRHISLTVNTFFQFCRLHKRRKHLPSIPSRIFFSPLSFSTDLATSLFSMYLKKRYSLVLQMTVEEKRGNNYIINPPHDLQQLP